MAVLKQGLHRSQAAEAGRQEHKGHPEAAVGEAHLGQEVQEVLQAQEEQEVHLEQVVPSVQQVHVPPQLQPLQHEPSVLQFPCSFLSEDDPSLLSEQSEQSTSSVLWLWLQSQD